MRGFRKDRIARAIREIVSEAIARQINDPRLAPLTTVSRVEVKQDLLLATVFVTVPTGAADERRTLAAMRSAGGFLQRKVARGLSMRHCPEIRFELDEELRQVQEIMRLLDANRRARGDDALTDHAGAVSGEETEASRDSALGDEEPAR